MVITVVLNFQVDPFIAYTIVMAKLIGELGSVGEASQYLSSLPVVHSWQLTTYTLLHQDMYGSGVLLAILHLVTGGPIILLTFLPIPGALSMCMLYLILRRLSKLVDATLRSASLIFSLVAIVSMYAYMLEDVVGKFYAFDFHAINYALYLMCLYCIIRLSESKSNRSYFVAVAVASAASNMIHYTLPLVLIGGLAAYVTFSWFVSGDVKMQRLPLLLAVISSLQSFYFGLLRSRANVSQTLTSLLEYFSGGFVEFRPTQAYALSPLYQVQILLAKTYTYSAVIFVVAVSAVLFRIRGRRPKPMAAAYCLIVGGSVVHFLSYFQYYGRVNFGFVGGWLLQPLLIVTVVMIWARQRRETERAVDTRSTATLDGFGSSDSGISKAVEKDSMPRALPKLMLATLLILNLLHAGNITLVADARLSYGAMVSEPGLESTDLQSFCITHLSGGHFLIGASSEVSSDLYSRLAEYDLDQVAAVIPAYFTGNSTFTSNTSLACAQLRHDFNYLILTSYELSNGLYGGVTSEGLWEYLNAREMTDLKSVLDSNQNLVYNSGRAYLYLLD
jgi:hypothetical protein